MQRMGFAAALLAAVVWLAPSLIGQTRTPQTPQFTARTDLVRTEVIVRDTRGSFVPTLTQADFELFEDGV